MNLGHLFQEMYYMSKGYKAYMCQSCGEMRYATSFNAAHKPEFGNDHCIYAEIKKDKESK